tara:strand:+ start:676 stop:1233 length:558 start_codon:yes stop_codon:yes gene_type:complete
MSKETSIPEVAKRYAKATFDLAEAENLSEAVLKDLTILKKIIIDNAELNRLISSPTFTSTDQLNVMNEIFKKQDISVLVKNLVNVLIRNRRINLLVSVINAYDLIMKSNSGEIIAEVITAAELKDDQKQEIVSNLKKMTGKEIQIQSKVQPEIIAGIKVKIGSQMIDASVSTKLNNLKILMKGAN